MFKMPFSAVVVLEGQTDQNDPSASESSRGRKSLTALVTEAWAKGDKNILNKIRDATGMEKLPPVKTGPWKR